RALEEKIALRKTEYRLCRQLEREELWDHLTDSLCRLAGPQIKETTVLVLDISDISKKYARKMEYLGMVRDGSEKQLASGYWACQVVGTEREGTTLLPLCSKLYSDVSPEWRGENRVMLEVIDIVSRHAGKRGIWVLDRGGDRGEILRPMLKRELHFLIRLRGDRHLIHRGLAQPVLNLASTCPLPYRESIIREEGTKEKVFLLEFGFPKVRLLGCPEDLYLVVVKGFGEKPLMLLTNVKITGSRRDLWRMVESYLMRWRIEETIRFIKQSYQLEDIRLLTYVRLQNMMALVTAVAYFTMAYLGLKTKLRVLMRHLLKAAKRVFGIPEFRFYALGDGIKEHLFARKWGFQGPNLYPQPESGQKWLFSS
ncbi:MAG TPA: transposase, partial [Spirochaetia bacterium]|nr:transposase [Spirochaetia bacterium]